MGAHWGHRHVSVHISTHIWDTWVCAHGYMYEGEKMRAQLSRKADTDACVYTYVQAQWGYALRKPDLRGSSSTMASAPAKSSADINSFPRTHPQPRLGGNSSCLLVYLPRVPTGRWRTEGLSLSYGLIAGRPDVIAQGPIGSRVPSA